LDVIVIRKTIIALLLLVGFLTALGWDLSARAQPATDAASAKETPKQRAPDTLFSIIFSGGPVGITIMLVLFGVSFTAAYLVFEQIMVLRRKEIMPEGLSEQVRSLILAGNIAGADQACRAKPSVLAAVLVHGVAEIEHGWSEVEKALEESLAEQSARLLRKVEYLSVIGTIAPMLGLLGTVTGMILAFQQVASSQGSAGAADLAQGIYSALVTTVAGLTIAIPCLAALAIFRNRIDQFVAEVAYQAQHAFAPLKRRSLAPSTPMAPPPPPGTPMRR
jgi:biopolymer transport protein ExbB